MEKVKERLRRATKVLDAAGIPCAVVGGNAVQVWVAQLDETAVRNTRDVDILLRRASLPDTIRVMEDVGFVFRHVAGGSIFLDGPDATARDAIHIVFAAEKVRPEYPEPTPDIEDYQFVGELRTLPLEQLVRMKLTSFRRQDQVHLMDMLEVGLIDKTWLARFPDELRRRLQELIDTPDG